MTAQAQEIKNMRLISHSDLNGFPNVGEGMAMQDLPGGRRVLWLAHESAPKDVTAVDVTDLANPKVVTQTDLPYPHLRSNSLAVIDNTMLVAYQSNQPDMPGAGMGVYDIENPEAPRQIAFFDTSGPYSRGVHCLWWVDGEYAYLSTGSREFAPRDQRDDQFCMIVDMKEPTRPTEVGRWALPGIRKGDEADLPQRHPLFDVGHRVHNVNVYPERPDRAYLGWIDAGVIILDISDKSDPQMISQLKYHPPFPGFTHTVVPIFKRDMLVVSQEANRHEHGEDYPKLIWLMDMRVEKNPVIMSTLPMPEPERFINTPGRYGAHNLHENQPLSNALQSDDLVFGTLFNAGLRVWDTSNPFQPEEVACFLPQAPDDAPNAVNDVYVDENRIVYTVDRLRGGLYILELTI